MLPCLEDDAVLGTQLAQLACGQHGVAFILHHLRGEACDSQFCCWSEHYGARPSTRSQRKCFYVFDLKVSKEFSATAKRSWLWGSQSRCLTVGKSLWGIVLSLLSMDANKHCGKRTATAPHSSYII